MQKSRNAFSMIELVFVIVVLGILAAVAVPKFAATRTDAHISKGRADIASVRSAIVNERQTRLIQGDSAFITGININSGDGLFGGVLMYPITASSEVGHWSKEGTADSNATSLYYYKVLDKSVLFEYNSSNGIFNCDTTDATYGEMCKLLVN